ncbi:hypothetical protein PRIPAC_92844, partial [Pristionchus pacificus]
SIDYSMTKLRSIKSEFGFVSRGDGSCSVSAGKSVVWASVNGPGDSHPSRRHGDKLYIESCYRPAAGDAESVTFNSLLRAALEHSIHTKLFPRAVLQVTVHEMQQDGSMCGLALTAAAMACMDAAIPMRAPFCGVQVILVNGEFIVDADSRTEAKADAVFNFAVSRERNESNEITPQVIASSHNGTFSLDELMQARSLAYEAANEIFSFYHESLQRKYTVESIA